MENLRLASGDARQNCLFIWRSDCSPIKTFQRRENYLHGAFKSVTLNKRLHYVPPAVCCSFAPLLPLFLTSPLKKKREKKKRLLAPVARLSPGCKVTLTAPDEPIFKQSKQNWGSSLKCHQESAERRRLQRGGYLPPSPPSAPHPPPPPPPPSFHLSAETSQRRKARSMPGFCQLKPPRHILQCDIYNTNGSSTAP